MPQDLNRHQHKAAAAEARPFPAGADQLAEYLRVVHEFRQAQGAPPQRESARFDLEGTRVVVTIMHPGGSLTASECVLLDLSTGGVGLLYPGFVHHDSQCVVHMETMDGEAVQIAGRTVWCRFVSKTVHSIGICWSEAVDVRQFVPSREWLEQMAGSDEFKNSELKGSMLAVGIDDLELGLLQSYLADTKIEVVSVPDSGAAIDRLSVEAFDFVMVDTDNPDTGLDAVRTHIVEEGGNEPMLLVTSRHDGATAYDSWGGASVLARPYSSDMVIGALRDLGLEQGSPLTGTRPIACELPSSKQGPARTYVDRLQKSVGQIGDAISADRADEALRFAQIVKNTASGFGFPLLEQAAEQAITAVNASGSAQESSGQLRTLCRVIERLCLAEDLAA